MSRSRITVAMLVGAVVLVTLAGCTAVSGPPPVASTPTPTPSATVEVPRAVAVIGDSMSLGVNACAEPGECREVSWALGDDPAVQSIATRLASGDGESLESVWAASNGARVADAVDAADAADWTGVELALVLIGANDACANTVAEITPTATFASDYATLLTSIRSSAPDAQIVALSVPDLLQLWEIGRTDPSATRLWDRSPSCGALLKDADSDAAADVARRAQVDAAVADYNAAITAACAAVEGCSSDDGAVNKTSYTADQISQIDFFHASAAGQALLADVVWQVLERDALAP